ncbi:hypothetical protein PR048_019874 [Dryococelus australis]|uniref:PiggyBac transposable element-derived protein domain-containing protein n=1 Tax=Dryococelus australis TaxID=614101 RepID=A0ABQ9H4T3_9NEOP|nr:hypothetical protein PR048_019874 [Dryococelus australis]
MKLVCENIRLVAANQFRAADNDTYNSSSESGEDNTAVDTICGDVVDWKWEQSLVEPTCHPFTGDDYIKKKYNKSKRARFGIKFYKLCFFANSYICNFNIYVGKGKADGNPTSTAIVMEMMQKCDLLNKGFSYMDNWKHIPKEHAKEKLKVEEAVDYSSTNITAMKWKDKREVSMLSTKHTLDFAETGKVHRKMQTKIMKRTAVMDYNMKMREDLVKRRSATPGDLPSRLSGRHFPEKLAPSAAKGAKFAKCYVVCLEKKQRRESTWKCDSCNVDLCIEHFKLYHTLKNY